MYETWIKLKSFKQKNGNMADIMIAHARHKPMPEIRIDYGCLTQWPVYDFLYNKGEGRVLWDKPEVFTQVTIKYVESLYGQLRKTHSPKEF